MAGHSAAAAGDWVVGRRKAFAMSDPTTQSMPDDLILAIASGKPVSLDDLARTGVDINAPGETNGRTPLTAAAFAGNTGLIRAIVGSGGVVDHPDRHGDTALMEAAAMGQDDVVRTLLDLGADIEVTAPGGLTALMIAAAWGNCEVVRLLLARGADLYRRDSRGSTALMIADEKYEDGAVEVLRAAGAVS